MTGSTTQLRSAFVVGLIVAIFAVTLQGVQGDGQTDTVISEVQCRPYIEKALKGREIGSVDDNSDEDEGVEVQDEVNYSTSEETKDNEVENEHEKATSKASDDDDDDDDDDNDNVKNSGEDSNDSGEKDDSNKDESAETNDNESDQVDSREKSGESSEQLEYERDEGNSNEATDDENGSDGQDSQEVISELTLDSDENQKGQEDDKKVENKTEEEDTANDKDDNQQSAETNEIDGGEDEINETDTTDSNESKEKSDEDELKSGEDKENNSSEEVSEINGKSENVQDATVFNDGTNETTVESRENENSKDNDSSEEKEKVDSAEAGNYAEEESSETKKSSDKNDNMSVKDENVHRREKREIESDQSEEKRDEISGEKSEENNGDSEESVEKSVGDDEDDDDDNGKEPTPEEDLIQEIEIPENLRPREHINQILKLDLDNEEKEAAIEKTSNIILKELKKLYDTAIKPLETLYKYRDLSNRHFGDPEIFSKPLVLFMGPWSGGKSSIINYLLDMEYKQIGLRTGAEPSPAYFNILMHGEEEEILDGTQLAADWTFSGLQKFGQGMLDRLRGLKLKNKLLEKVNIVEIPGILEIRKQVQRLFPFNDACQWFIDRADIIFLVYDPSKLDVGPETEAILDQLKGREYQTRIILNKADQVKPEELMRVQGALIWNISPLMSSAEPPIMYSASLWSMPYEIGAPTRLLYAQERAFLRDLRSAVDKRVEHKIASARRFAVRVRNHAKMVDCYLTTYFNHKSFFGSKAEISGKIIENPQDYHIYEGLSTLTNISRYDLPDPDVYRDFFRLNPLYDFQSLSSTCTYFRGCPINRLDVAIAYDLPELVGKYKKSIEAVLHEENKSQPSTS